MHDLTIDSKVRDWVFIPLTIVIILMNMLRQYAHIVRFPATAGEYEAYPNVIQSNTYMQYMNIGNNGGASTMKDIQEQQTVRRSVRVRMMANMLTYDAYAKRKAYFVGKEHGVLCQEMPATNMQAKMMSDPTMMTNMLKSQLTGTAPHLLMGFLVNQFFAGFIMGKIPFTLSPRFKSMLQRGIDMASLDVSYFTSLSFYILLLFGLRGVLSLIFSGDVIDESAVMSHSMRGASPAFDAKQEYKSEQQRYDLVDHRWVIADAEAKALKILKSKLRHRISGINDVKKAQ